MVSVEDVFRFLRSENLVPRDKAEDVAFLAVTMAADYSRRARRGEPTFDDAILVLKWLCKIPVPGKPPQDRRAKALIAKLAHLSRTTGHTPLVLPTGATRAPPQNISPLRLLVRLDVLTDSELSEITGRARRPAARGRTMVPLERILSQFDETPSSRGYRVRQGTGRGRIGRSLVRGGETVTIPKSMLNSMDRIRAKLDYIDGQLRFLTKEFRTQAKSWSKMRERGSGRRRAKRRPSEYNLFLMDKMKQGMTMTEAVGAWKQRGGSSQSSSMSSSSMSSSMGEESETETEDEA